MDRLAGRVQRYAWGSPTVIPALTGRHPTGEPEAELWFGTHPMGPSTIVRDGSERSLAEIVELPYLLKVLAAERPLSLQAHPSPEQARVGFAREEAAGVGRDSPERSFRDASAKPELICALTPFDALCGFRSIEATLALLRGLAVRGLGPIVDRLERFGESALRNLVGDVLLGRTSSPEVVAEVAAAAGSLGPFPAERDWIRRLADEYPGDPGVVIALLMNLVRLEPGDALFLGAGNLHSYLRGTAVEVMAASDNVVRGGLTPKHIDIETLVEILDARPITVDVQRRVPGCQRYEAPTPDFSLTRLEIDGELSFGAVGPQILLVTEGTLTVGGETVPAGDAMYYSDSDCPLLLAGQATAFVAAPGVGPVGSLEPSTDPV